MSALLQASSYVSSSLWAYVGGSEDDDATNEDLIQTSNLIQTIDEGEEATYENLIQTTNNTEDLVQNPKTQKRRSVADLAAKFEQSAKSETKTNEQPITLVDDRSPPPTSYSEMAYSGATYLLGFVTGTTDVQSSSEDLEAAAAGKTSKNSSPARVSFTVPQDPSNERRCRICEKKIFPTDESITCRQNTYHVACFRCTSCQSKLKNHPDEEHKVVGTVGSKHHMILQCRQCKIDDEHKNKPRTKGSVAGQKIVVEEDEQGDIDQVVDAIGDDLEEAVWGMIPRCATCGGDFLSYRGHIPIVGSLKYHNECFLTGKPGAGCSSLTMEPVQGARYLPDNFILKLTNGTGKVITTLFFIWKDKEAAMKTMRVERKNSVSVKFELDEEARANPNYKGKSNAQNKTTAHLPPKALDGPHLGLELIGGDQIAPEPPMLIEPVAVFKGYQNASCLKATMWYSKYKLDHSLLLEIPYTSNCDSLSLLGSTLTIQINEYAGIEQSL